MDIQAGVQSWVVVGEPRGMFEIARRCSRLRSPAKPSIATFKSCYLLCGVILVGSTIEPLDEAVSKLSL
jgi:hypothetical protein